MKTFIWTVVALAALEAACALFNLATGDTGVLTPAIRALNIASMVVLVVWGVWVLRGSKERMVGDRREEA